MSDNDKLHYTICAISGFLVALITYWITGKIMPGGSIICGFFSPVLGNTKWYSSLAGMVFGFIGFLNFLFFIEPQYLPYLRITAILCNLAICEIYLGPVRTILEYIHTAIDFFKETRLRRSNYYDFREQVKARRIANFEARAKEIVK